MLIECPAIAATHDTVASTPALSTAQTHDLNTAASELAAAVDGLRRSGNQEYLPRGLLTRAWLRRLSSQLGYVGDNRDMTCVSNNRSEKTCFFTPKTATDVLPEKMPDEFKVINIEKLQSLLLKHSQ